ncbi:hypothetical protein [Dyadobacter arcticus]|uniref:DUF2281 domain-containing protein n=1 Tax=Dyadobacter arcticus TaxID=1078754 RepID=A0ABX0UJ74_9BACT|nr:hypothetical protein [Dyadobacter arcticus]NIJ51615.1 hypothetical protein [Dyadobacter arcticus]
MIRTLLVPDNQDISLQLPKSFVGKQVEVIAFTINETLAGSHALNKPMIHYASQQVLSKDWSTSEEDQAWENL